MNCSQLLIMKMKIAFVKDENEKPGKKMKMNWLCLGGDPKKVANECDENIFARFLKNHKYNELRSLPDKERVEYPGYSSSSHHYQNLPSSPFSVPCCPGRVACNMSPKFAPKNGHRPAADAASCGGDADAYDQPPPHSKQRLHHPQRARKHCASGSKSHNCHYVNCDHNRSLALAAENLPKTEPPPSPIACAESVAPLPATPYGGAADQVDGNGAAARGSYAGAVNRRMASCASPANSCASPANSCASPSNSCASLADSCASPANSCASSADSCASLVGCRAASLTGSPLTLLIPPPASIYMLSKADQRLSESFYSSEDDLRIISESQRHLRLSGWYHSRLSWPQASEILMHAPVGTFLVRNSSDVNHLYSLSVQTKCGPTSIRIHYAKGAFRLAGGGEEAKQLPTFPSIMQLVQHYAERTQKLPLPCTPDENHNWANVGGPPTTTPVVLRKPMYAEGQVPSLKHLSRLCVNRHIKDSSFVPVLQAPAFVIKYLTEYPFKL